MPEMSVENVQVISITTFKVVEKSVQKLVYKQLKRYYFVDL